MKFTLLFLLVIVLLNQSCIDSSSLKEDRQNALFKQKEKEEAERKEKINHLITLSDSLHAKKSINESISFLDSALVYAKIEKGSIYFKKGSYLQESRSYEDAGIAFVESAEGGFKKDTSYYQAALCYEKVRKRQEAVDNLKKAISFGHQEASVLHDRINPERKRVSGYVIRCCDGTTSYSKSRRGTCSHHGGVCNWNEPVYETYRKY
ncbi:MAG: DUF3761 domain-containing protein [bacterium]|nr:DUF3761 domain-containing protein [bacterium]